jgi:hypothetical protein
MQRIFNNKNALHDSIPRCDACPLLGLSGGAGRKMLARNVNSIHQSCAYCLPAVLYPK